MAEIANAYVSIMASARGFGSSLTNEINPGLDSAGRSGGARLGSLLGKGAIAGAVVAMAGIAAVIHTGLGEAMDASAGTAQLAAGIKSTGNAAGVSVDGLNAMASSIQGMSGQTDDSIVASEQLLLTFTNIKNSGTDKIFDRATLATANMAAKMGGDAAGSAIQLGKALNDPIKGVASLGRMGVQFTDSQKESIKAMMEMGDTAGAQKIILGELETQFGGAAEAAGNSLPGQLAKAKRSFEDVSQSVAEGLLPVILPGLTSIGDTITTKVIPAITGFIQGFKDSEGPGGTFRDVLTAVYEQGIKPVGDFLTGTAVPAIAGFVQEFKNGEGPGGTLRDILVNIRDNALVPLATFITDTALPALGSIYDWIIGPGASALGDFKQWVDDSKVAIENFATFITVILLPVFADMAVKAVASALTQAGAWASTSAAGVTSAGSQLISHYTAVGGWGASATAAITSGGLTVAIWALMAQSAIVNAARSVVAMITMDVQWLVSSAAAVLAGIVTAGVWVAQSATAALNAALTVGWLVFVAVQGWAVQAAAAVVAGATTAGVWIAQAAEAVVGAAANIVSFAIVAGGWVATAATAMASGVVMAAAWLVGLGPIGWIIAAVIAVGAVFVVLYNKVGWFRDGVDAAWAWIKSSSSSLFTWFGELPGKIGDLFSNAGTWLKDAGTNIISGFLTGLTDKFEDVKDFVGGIGTWIADHKGPKAYDLKLLTPAGGWIMTGLRAGIEDEIPALEATLNKVTGAIKLPNVNPGMSGVSNTASGVSADSRGGITNNIYEAVSARATAMQVSRIQSSLAA